MWNRFHVKAFCYSFSLEVRSPYRRLRKTRIISVGETYYLHIPWEDADVIKKSRHRSADSVWARSLYRVLHEDSNPLPYYPPCGDTDVTKKNPGAAFTLGSPGNDGRGAPTRVLREDSNPRPYHPPCGDTDVIKKRTQVRRSPWVLR